MAMTIEIPAQPIHLHQEPGLGLYKDEEKISSEDPEIVEPTILEGSKGALKKVSSCNLQISGKNGRHNANHGPVKRDYFYKLFLRAI